MQYSRGHNQFFLYIGGTQTRQCHLGEESPFFTLYIEDTIRDFGTSDYPECYKKRKTNTTISGIPAKQYRNIILSDSGSCAFPSSYARDFTCIAFPHNDQIFVVAYREDEDIVMKQTILSTLSRGHQRWPPYPSYPRTARCHWNCDNRPQSPSRLTRRNPVWNRLSTGRRGLSTSRFWPVVMAWAPQSSNQI
jgi:hypothetical protein